MYSETQDQEIQRLCNRHQAQLLTKLNEIKIPEIVVDAIKRQFNFLQADLKTNLQEIGNNAGNKKETN